MKEKKTKNVNKVNTNNTVHATDKAKCIEAAVSWVMKVEGTKEKVTIFR